MNQMLIDNGLLASAAIIALLITRYSKQRKTGAVGSFFLLFPPLVIFLNMWAHTVAVSLVNYNRYLAGSFQYSFTFYSLMLFGIVFIISSGINIHLSRLYIKGDKRRKPAILWLNLGMALLFLPMSYFNPIALLPVLASIVSSVALWLVRPITSPAFYNKDPQQNRTAAAIV